MDDQFAYVPAAFAPAYFGTALTDQRTGGNRHYSVPNTHTNCMWPEGQLTCRVLASGARLELLRVSTRLDKFTNWGKCPPVRPNAPSRPRGSAFASGQNSSGCWFTAGAGLARQDPCVAGGDARSDDALAHLPPGGGDGGGGGADRAPGDEGRAELGQPRQLRRWLNGCSDLHESCRDLMTFSSKLQVV